MSAVEHEASQPVFHTCAGTVEEVRHQLRRVKGDQAVAVVLDRSSENEAKAIEQVLARLFRLTRGSLASHNDDALARIVEILLPREAPSPTLLLEAEMLLRAKVEVLEGADWLTAPQIASIAGFGAKNPNAKLHKWKRDSAIFAVRLRGIDYFPGYILDPKHEYRPYRALKEVIEHFNGAKEGWGLAFWFQSVNSFLGGKRPMDLLARKPDVVIAAAADEAMRAAHA